MRSLLRKFFIVAMMGVFAIMVTGCSRYWDLAKIVGRNLVYELQNPVRSPAAKMNLPSSGNPENPQIYAGWIGHSTVFLSFAGTQVLTDPNFSSQVKIARRIVGLPIEPEEIKNLQLILISHSHYDHLDLPSLKRLPKEAVVVIPPGCRDLVEGLGFAGIVELGWNERFTFQDLQGFLRVGVVLSKPFRLICGDGKKREKDFPPPALFGEAL